MRASRGRALSLPLSLAQPLRGPRPLRPLALALALALALVSGCIGSADDDLAGNAGAPVADLLSFLPSTALGGAYLGNVEASCAAYNCGASEPTIEVAGDGTLYVSGVCCIGQSPPIWVSRDGGASFELLPGDLLRDHFGIEGDFAVDDAGNMYFSDISAASAYFSSWDKDGAHRWTMPAWPFAPLVDRPWVRAAAEDQVFFAYNTGRSTVFATSEDGARTWTVRDEFPAGLGALGQGPEREHLWIVADFMLYESTDAGLTWSEGERVPTPTSGGNRFQAPIVPVVDEGGFVYVVYDWRDEQSESDDEPYHVFVSRRAPDGAWAEPLRVSPAQGTHHLPWPAAGREGALVIAWYRTLDDEAGPDGVSDDAEWFLHVATSIDADAAEPTFQVSIGDPEPVHTGPMMRKLLDFLQVDIAPDGAVHIAYAEDRNGEKDELTHHVKAIAGAPLAPLAYPNGPK